MTDQAEMSTPPSAGDPEAAVTAGTPTSTVPIAIPKPREASTTVRIAGRPSAPSRPREARAGWARSVRTGRLSAKPSAPITIAVAATTRPVPGHGVRIRNAASAGPTMKKTSRLIAS